MKNILSFIIFFLLFGNLSAQLLPGAYQTQEYISLIKNKKIGIVANASSLIKHTHLVDSLIKLNIDIVRVFAPEHGFRGKAEAGAHIKDGIDKKTQLEVISLYGSNKKPSKDQLHGVEIMIFDLQGVGARFYTYISTMTYVMQACAENNIPLIILDRPNPNIHYIDGPVLQMEQQSFVGLLPIPIVYGMSDAELALMINGEKWLENEEKCDLKIIKIKNYNRESVYKLPIKPSPNLPNFQSIYLYPSLCLFEGTKISIGRGTNFPFQVIGDPQYPNNNFSFTPKSIAGVSKHPKFENQKCFGLDLHEKYHQIQNKPYQINLSYLLEFYDKYTDKENFFNPFFEKLAGTTELRKQIKNGWTETEIRKSWEKDLDDFKNKRKPYLIY